MEKVHEVKDTLIEKWKNLGRIGKISISLGIVSLIAVIIFSTYLKNKTNYSVLFSDLSDADSGNIVKNLDERGVKYKLEDKGSKVLVESNSIDKTRIELAMDNQLPNKSTGFEIFDEKNMMTTDEDRKIMYQRAVTGELQRSIESLEAVKEAKVMLVTPDKSIFEDKNKESSASIILKLKPNQILSEEAIKGIASLTSGAVENLPQKNIKIVDEQGNVLSDILDEKRGNGSTDLANKYQKMKDDLEIKLEDKTGNMLNTLFDKDKLNVAVNVDLDFDSIERTSVTYDKPKVRSEEIRANSDGAGIDQQAIEGGNIQDNVTNVIGEDGENGKSYSHIINNELDTETTKVLNAPGVVKRVTASVLINENLSVQEKNQIEELVQSAVGYDRDRGDKITIQGIKIATDEEANEDNQNEGNASFMKNILSNPIFIGIIAAIIVTALVIIFLVIRNKKKKDNYYDYEDLDVSGQMINEVPSEKIDEIVSNIEENEQKMVKPEILNEEDNLKYQDAIEKEEKAKRYAKENPELAAELIKVWMKDE